jgi:non-ribosomal peptide synthetase component F
VLLLCQLIVMRAESAFLLIDPSLPRERMQYLLSDSKAVLLLHDSSTAAPAELPVPAMEVFEHAVVDMYDGAEDGCTIDELLPSTHASRLMYVCYTSGSTGRPKGCAVNHCALRAYAHANATAHAIDASSRVLLASAVSFDPCIGEAWTALVACATLCLPPRASVKASLGSLLAATATSHVSTRSLQPGTSGVVLSASCDRALAVVGVVLMRVL